MGGGTLEWYKRRIQRIYIPYELFLLTLAAIWMARGMNLLAPDWLWLLLGLKGVKGHVLGANHTWFITALLICYLVTPPLKRLSQWMDVGCWRKGIIVSLLAVLPVILAAIPLEVASTLGDSVVWYSFGYLLGVRFDVQMRYKRSCASVSFAVIIVLFSVRIIARHYADGTVWYDRIIVPYVMAGAAFCIFYLFAYLFWDCKLSAYIRRFSDISFEVYLYHYMFCTGPLRLFDVTPNWVAGCVLVTVVTVVLASAMYKAAEMLRGGHKMYQT